MNASETTIGSQPDNLWFYVLKLIRLRWMIIARGFKHAKPLRKALTLLIGLLILASFVGSYLLTTFLLNLVDSPLVIESGVNLDGFVHAIPALIVSGGFLGILLFSFGVLLQGLYLANDMDFLLLTPIPIRAVFLTKLLEAILPNFILVIVFGLPVLFSLGAYGGYSILYFPLVLVALAFLSLAAAGISGLMVMAVVRILPAKRVAEGLTFLAAILFIVLSQWTNLTGIDFRSLSSEQISMGTQVLSALNTTWSPLAWVGRGLVDVGEGRWLSGIFSLALTSGLSGGIFWVVMAAAERLYLSGWASIRTSTQHKKTRLAVDRRAMNNVSVTIFRQLLPPAVQAIVLKDFKELRRDISNLSQVIKPLVLGIIFAVMLLSRGTEPPVVEGEGPALFMVLFQSVLAYGSTVLSLFVGWMVLINLALISFSMEGKSYWILKTAPVSAGKQLAAKFLIAYLPALILGWLFLTGMALIQKAPPSILLYGFPLIALILAGLDGIILAMGVRAANLDWTDPRHMSDNITVTLGMIAGFLYLVVALLLFFAPLIGLPLLGIMQGSGQVIGLLAGGTFALACMILPLVAVKDRVGRIGEE
jgi:ABC-2 type transport system permease protein